MSGGAAQPLPRTGFVLLALLTVFWGVNWPFMKLGLTEFRPWSLRALCMVVGPVGLFVCGWLARQRLGIARGDMRAMVLASLFNTTGWHLLSAFGLSQMASGRAAIIAFTMPLWATLLAVPLLGEPLTRVKLAGLALGLAGLALLLGLEIGAVGRAPVGAAMMFGASLAWAAGSLIVKRHPWRTEAFALTAWQLVIGGVPILIGWALIDGLSPLRPGIEAPSLAAIVGLLYAATIPMIFCHWGWVRLLAVFPASVAAIGTLLIPVVGVFSSALVLGEPVGLPEIAALVLIVASLAIVLGPRLPPIGRRAAGSG